MGRRVNLDPWSFDRDSCGLGFPLRVLVRRARTAPFEPVLSHPGTASRAEHCTRPHLYRPSLKGPRCVLPGNSVDSRSARVPQEHEAGRQAGERVTTGS